MTPIIISIQLGRKDEPIKRLEITQLIWPIERHPKSKDVLGPLFNAPELSLVDLNVSRNVKLRKVAVTKEEEVYALILARALKPI